MLAPAVAFIAGCWGLQQQAALPDQAYALLLAAGVFALWLVPGTSPLARGVRRGGWLLAVFCAGFLWAAHLAHLRVDDMLPRRWEGADVALTGVVAELPRAGERGVRFSFAVEAVHTPGARVPQKLLLNWFVRDAAQRQAIVHPGERWSLTVRLKRPHGTSNPHGFDVEAWLMEAGIGATGYVAMAPPPRRLDAFVMRPGYLVERAREAVAERFDRLIGAAPYGGVLKALAIGEQREIPAAQWDVFIATGVNHLISISGLHVTMVSSLAYAAMLFLWRRSARLTQWLAARRAAVLVAVLAAFSYVLLAGFAVPAQRTLYMLGVIGVALYLGFTARPAPVLAVAALVVVVVVLDPWAVLAPGFWLSFGAVAAMMYAAAGRLGREGAVRTWLRGQWAVTLALAPVLLLLFQQVSVVSPLANAFAIPVVSLVVTPLTLLAIVPPFGFLLPLAHWVMGACYVALQCLAALPMGVWRQPEPAVAAVLLGAAGVAWMLLPRGVPARWLGAVCLLPMFLTPAPRPAPGEMWLDVLDVGQGLAAVVRTRDHAFLYDAGPAYGAESDGGSRVIVPWLRGEGVGRLAGMVVSHDDSDHYGGAASVLRAVPADWVSSSLRTGHPAVAPARRALACFAGQRWVWDGVEFEVLHPTLASYGDARIPDNDRSCVVKVTSAHGSVLLSGDIERIAELELTERVPEKLASTVMTVPHHGSRTSSIVEFVAAVRPRIAIVSAGYRNRFGHPKGDVMARYRALDSAVLRTDYAGAVSVHFGAARPSVTEWRRERRRYWQDAVK